MNSIQNSGQFLGDERAVIFVSQRGEQWEGAHQRLVRCGKSLFLNLDVGVSAFVVLNCTFSYIICMLKFIIKRKYMVKHVMFKTWID